MLNIRKANSADLIYIRKTLSHIAKIPYITRELVENDIANESCYILEKGNNKIGFVSLVYDAKYSSYYLKRGLIPSKKNRGKGYSEILFESVLSFVAKGNIVSITPWTDNFTVQKIVTKLGFEYKYTFNENYMLYQKEIC